MKIAPLTRLIPIVAVLALLVAPGCQNDTGGQNANSARLTVGIQNSPSNALVIVAAYKGFFDSTKASISVKEFSAGKLALQSMLGQARDVDVAVCAETPIALSTLGKNDLRVFTQIVKSTNECRMVVRKEKNENTPAEYFSKKRKVATSLGGSPEWFTYGFIRSFHLDTSRIEIVAMLPENMPVALANGGVDAISIFDPYARIGEKNLGDAGLTFTNSNVVNYYVMAAKEATLTNKPAAFQELMSGLAKAEQFINDHPDEARQIVALKTHLDIGIIKDTWANYRYGIGLERHFAELCKQEAEWATQTGKYPAGTPIPDFGKVAYPNLLKQVAPSKTDL